MGQTPNVLRPYVSQQIILLPSYVQPAMKHRYVSDGMPFDMAYRL